MSPVVLDAITDKTRGIGAKHINVSDVCNALVPVPPLEEQIRIVAALSTVIPMLKSL
jgi:type I restriction enzyme S subunit